MSASVSSTEMSIPSRPSINKQQDFINFLEEKDKTIEKTIYKKSSIGKRKTKR